MILRTCLAAFLITCFNGAFADAPACPAPPLWMKLKSSLGTCAYFVTEKGKFTSSEFVDFIDLLTRDTSGHTKRVSLGTGEYTFNRAIQVSGSNGWLVQIIGDGSSSTRLVFNDSHGVSIEGPFAIGLIDKLTINGNGKRGMQNDAHKDKAGVLARRGANIRLGRDVVVEEFSRVGVQAFMSSTIFAAGVISKNNGSDGFVAAYNSTVYARDAVATGNRGDGFFSEAASSIDAVGSSAKYNVIDRSNGHNRGGDGYVAVLGGVINADNVEVEGNEDQDFVVFGQSVIYARNTISKAKVKSQIRDNSTLVIR